jgi:hypothetical protein
LAAVVLSYDEVRRALESERCTARGSHPSAWWNHLVIGDFWIDITGGQVSEAQFALIMNDIIKNRPP